MKAHTLVVGMGLWHGAGRRTLIEALASGTIQAKAITAAAEAGISIQRELYAPRFEIPKIQKENWIPARTAVLKKYLNPATGERFSISQWLKLSPKARAELVRQSP